MGDIFNFDGHQISCMVPCTDVHKMSLNNGSRMEIFLVGIVVCRLSEMDGNNVNDM